MARLGSWLGRLTLKWRGTTDCRLCDEQRAREGKSSFSGRPSLTAKEGKMELLYSRCAGLDVHKKSVSACVRINDDRGKTQKETAVFGTFTADLEHLCEWLQKHRVTHVALESTGVFWMPVWNVLEQSDAKFELVLINPQHVHALPGRKTDQKDCERIAELLQYGLLKGSFIPPAPIRELRDLTRCRTHLQAERNRVLNRIRRLLETVNVKVGSVVSDIGGKTARLILAQISRGNYVAEELAKLAQASLKNKRAELTASLKGFYTEHFRWLLAESLQELVHLDRKLEQVDKRLARQLEPHTDLMLRLCTVPGVEFTTAAVIIAEIGFDMSRFPDPAHLASWAGLCPGNNESAGKRYSGCTRKGNRYLRRVLTQSAWSITRKKDCFLTALFWRISARGGRKKAALAVAHRILTIVWHIIGEGKTYQEIGANYYDRQHPDRSARRLVRRLEQLGFDVDAKPKAPAPTAPTAVDSTSVQTSSPDPPSSRSRTRPPKPAADPPQPHQPTQAHAVVCRRCARWGIECIHARHAKRFSSVSAPSAESVT
jgi:transposase